MSASVEPLVLLVDDYEDTREMTADFLRGCDFRVASASNGLEAVECADAIVPNLIVLDLSLPVLDGWGAIARLRENPRTREIPILAVSGLDVARVGGRAMEAGCVGFLGKPCSPRALVAEVQRILTDVAAAEREAPPPSGSAAGDRHGRDAERR